MFRRSFLSSLGVLPFFGFSSKKKTKVQIIELKNKTLFIDTEKRYIFKEIKLPSEPYDPLFTITYYFNEEGQIHRDDGPAVENSTGYKAYYKNGIIHRDNGPAVEYQSGTKYYCTNGTFIRHE